MFLNYTYSVRQFSASLLILRAGSRCLNKGYEKGANPFIQYPLIFCGGVWNTAKLNKWKKVIHAIARTLLPSCSQFRSEVFQTFHREKQERQAQYVFVFLIFLHFDNILNADTKIQQFLVLANFFQNNHPIRLFFMFSRCNKKRANRGGVYWLIWH